MITQTSDHKPSNSEMMGKLQGKQPEQAVLMLNDYKSEQWKALNSYVHALQRHGAGYPEKLVKEIIKSSNGLLTMTAMMAAILTGNEHIVKDITKIQYRHKACLFF